MGLRRIKSKMKYLLAILLLSIAVVGYVSAGPVQWIKDVGNDIKWSYQDRQADKQRELRDHFGGSYARPPAFSYS